MKLKLLAAAALLACAGTSLASTGASAQWMTSLSGPYHCVQNCQVPLNGQAFVTQNGWDLNLVNEVGQPAHGWIDYPGHIWIDWWHEGAMFSPDGSTIQFDSGSVWQRS
jgi:hypothetical protein